MISQVLLLPAFLLQGAPAPLVCQQPAARVAPAPRPRPVMRAAFHDDEEKDSKEKAKLLGGGIGAVVGGVVFYATSEGCGEENGYWICLGRGFTTAVGAMFGWIVGYGVAALVTSGDGSEPVPVPHRGIRFMVAPVVGEGSAGFGVRLRF